MEPPTPTGTELEAALAPLADLVLPPSVGWWPQTWGWAVLALALALLAGLAAWRWLAVRRRNRYRRQALARLVELAAQRADKAGAVLGMVELLKRTALAAWPRTAVAELAGAEWLAFLEAHGGGTRIVPRVASLLDDAEYRPRGAQLDDAAFSELVATCRSWIENHRVPA